MSGEKGEILPLLDRHGGLRPIRCDSITPGLIGTVDSDVLVRTAMHTTSAKGHRDAPLQSTFEWLSTDGFRLHAGIKGDTHMISDGPGEGISLDSGVRINRLYPRWPHLRTEECGETEQTRNEWVLLTGLGHWS
jgi:hypothetical protein